jgi:hypothetical protein
VTKEELAAKLTGREYTQEITEAEGVEAKKSGLIVIFGGSDDLVELRGAIYDEVDAYDGGTVLIAPNGTLLPGEIDRDDETVLRAHNVFETVQARRDLALKIEALWCKEPGYSWTYKTAAPHATFEVMEDGEHYCRGVVIDLKEMRIS